MLFQRKIYAKLLDWKEQTNGKKAVLIEGARRIGKSTICEEFGKQEYRSYLLINFARTTEDVKEYFDQYMEDLDTLFMLLSTRFGTKLYERESVIIFDEVQACPRAREAIKFLVEDGRYDYMETGSLVSIKENVQNIVIPSEERQIRMYPMDFEEFCWAMGEAPLVDYIRKCFVDEQPLNRELHNKAMMLFKQYMLVGGMPKPVETFLKNRKQFEEADLEKRDILNLYRNDIEKIRGPYKNKVTAIYDQIPGLLSRHEKRVVFKDVQDKTSASNYEETFFWLANSMIANECFRCNDPNVGLSLNEDRAYIKCYMGDTGLLVSHAFDENELLEESVYAEILSGNLGINEGMLYENAIAQMLTANGHKLYFYTRYNKEKHRNDIEIDFLITNRSKTRTKLFPIEVKSGKKYSTTSLARFRETYGKRIGECYVIHPRNLIRKETYIAIPPYMAICL